MRRNQSYKNYNISHDIKNMDLIDNNLDFIIFQKMNLLMAQQKNEESTRSCRNIHNKSIKYNINNYCNNKYNNKFSLRKQESINKRITLGKFLMQNNSQNEIKINNDNNKESNGKDNNNKDNDINNKKDDLKKEEKKEEKKEVPLSYFKRKQRDRIKNLQTLKYDLENLKHFKLSVNKADQIVVQKKLSKRYTLFKTILNYLESNNITLYELLNNNPFQSKPYELINSYDFLVAVKFKNYTYVNEALSKTKRYLFSFDYFGQTAYHWAAKLDDIQMLELLMDYGLYHNQKDFKGRTPLYLAAVNNHKDVCNFLLNNNGNIFLKDKKGLSPADVAGSKELKYYLYDYMAQPFSNPLYKARIKNFLKDRDERIKKKKEKAKEENYINSIKEKDKIMFHNLYNMDNMDNNK